MRSDPCQPYWQQTICKLAKEGEKRIMTRREAGIVSAYTRKLCGDIQFLYEYLEEKLGAPVMTHEIPYLLDKHHEMFKQDFVDLKIADRPDSNPPLMEKA